MLIIGISDAHRQTLNKQRIVIVAASEQRVHKNQEVTMVTRR